MALVDSTTGQSCLVTDFFNLMCRFLIEVQHIEFAKINEVGGDVSPRSSRHTNPLGQALEVILRPSLNAGHSTDCINIPIDTVRREGTDNLPQCLLTGGISHRTRQGGYKLVVPDQPFPDYTSAFGPCRSIRRVEVFGRKCTVNGGSIQAARVGVLVAPFEYAGNGWRARSGQGSSSGKAGPSSIHTIDLIARNTIQELSSADVAKDHVAVVGAEA